MNSEHQNKILEELESFNELVEVHNLPEIFHYWSNRFLRPMLEEFGYSHPDEVFVDGLLIGARNSDRQPSRFLSVGSGNCDTEIRIAKNLLDRGLRDFKLECLELNSIMLDRGRKMAKESEVESWLSFTEADFNSWSSEATYCGIIANQSLHHVSDLEHLFEALAKALLSGGRFVVNDMIGRNGHQRWPEALKAVHRFWVELPSRYHFNHQLRRTEELYENWDCSTQGFEGIRAQEILPLLIEHFHFELSIAFGNVIDVFIDRAFGHNFSLERQSDRDFIDRVHAYDERAIQAGELSPTHLIAILQKESVDRVRFSRGLTPEFCVRKPY